MSTHKPCKICGRPSRRGGFCATHYTEYIREHEKAARSERLLEKQKQENKNNSIF